MWGLPSNPPPVHPFAPTPPHTLSLLERHSGNHLSCVYAIPLYMRSRNKIRNCCLETTYFKFNILIMQLRFLSHILHKISHIPALPLISFIENRRIVRHIRSRYMVSHNPCPSRRSTCKDLSWEGNIGHTVVACSETGVPVLLQFMLDCRKHLT